MQDAKNTAGTILNIAVFASHNGSNLQAIIDACNSGAMKANVCVVLSNNSDSRALQRAADAGIDSFHVSAKALGSDEAADAEIMKILTSHNTDIIFLAGYLKRIGESILNKYHNRVFNVHPALLPKYGGRGMFGMNVHSAVIAAGEPLSGITIHRASQEYDEGEVVAQTTIVVSADDTAETLAQKILAREHTFIVEVINQIIEGGIALGDPK
ncbi:MAG: phosphoribosylglycinamide formyltransferase [Dehalococcoidia bacterium]|nr:phosphoribosylglycinamide formyltransferase [Dehalococcoidia bacterium]